MQWRADSGEYVIHVGESSRDLRLSQPFSLETAMVIE
ncbi:MAG: hypothetical protein ACLFO5_07630 [Opitutales bacterium]